MFGQHVCKSCTKHGLLTANPTPRCGRIGTHGVNASPPGHRDRARIRPRIWPIHRPGHRTGQSGWRLRRWVRHLAPAPGFWTGASAMPRRGILPRICCCGWMICRAVGLLPPIGCRPNWAANGSIPGSGCKWRGIISPVLPKPPIRITTCRRSAAWWRTFGTERVRAGIYGPC